jgi:hypothetical protein
VIYDNKTFTKIYPFDTKNMGSSSYNFEDIAPELSHKNVFS